MACDGGCIKGPCSNVNNSSASKRVKVLQGVETGPTNNTYKEKYDNLDIYTDYLRDDVEEPSLSKDDILRNAKDVVDGQIKLPKVVG